MCWLCIMHAYCVHLLPQIKVRLSCGNLMPHNCALNANNDEGEQRGVTAKRRRLFSGGEERRKRKTKTAKDRATTTALSCSHAILMRLIFINATARTPLKFISLRAAGIALQTYLRPRIRIEPLFPAIPRKNSFRVAAFEAAHGN